MKIEDFKDKIKVGAKLAVRGLGKPNFHNLGAIRSIVRNEDGDILMFIVDWWNSYKMGCWGPEAVIVDADGNFFKHCVEMVIGDPEKLEGISEAWLNDISLDGKVTKFVNGRYH